MGIDPSKATSKATECCQFPMLPVPVSNSQLATLKLGIGNTCTLATIVAGQTAGTGRRGRRPSRRTAGESRGRIARRTAPRPRTTHAFVNEADMSAIATSRTVFLNVEFLMRPLSIFS